MDIPLLNAKMLFVESLLPGNLLVLETSYERLVLLCQEDKSVFLRPNIYPALKYYLRPGDETQCMEELTQLFQTLKVINTSIQSISPL
jgi:hypothetical protein